MIQTNNLKKKKLELFLKKKLEFEMIQTHNNLTRNPRMI